MACSPAPVSKGSQRVLATLQRNTVPMSAHFRSIIWIKRTLTLYRLHRGTHSDTISRAYYPSPVYRSC